MKVRVMLFAAARQLAGQEALDIPLPDQATVGDLRAAMRQECPQLADLLDTAMFAIDTEYADETARIPGGAEVACIPPVSGG